jgi:hypothetical protein
MYIQLSLLFSQSDLFIIAALDPILSLLGLCCNNLKCRVYSPRFGLQYRCWAPTISSLVQGRLHWEKQSNAPGGYSVLERGFYIHRQVCTLLKRSRPVSDPQSTIRPSKYHRDSPQGHRWHQPKYRQVHCRPSLKYRQPNPGRMWQVGGTLFVLGMLWLARCHNENTKVSMMFPDFSHNWIGFLLKERAWIDLLNNRFGLL